MATTKKPAEELVINNPHYNASHQLGFFDGMKVIETVDSKGNHSFKADRTDPETMRLIKVLQEWPRIPGCGDGGASAPRVKVGGKEYTLSNKFFTATEAENYKNYGKDHGKGGSGSSTKKVNGRDIYDKLTALIDSMSSKKGDNWKEAAALVEEFRDDNFIDCLSLDELRDMLKKNKNK